ncbi:uncharacterized protein [Miscanthus floridulus]|uniref:uncharacterized protein n=1 Tax=Miscanthus floridulus TaxID=154761 RepID=UPI00345B3387
MARDRLADDETEDFVIRIVGPRDGDPPQYSLPTIDQLAMLVVGDFSYEAFERDIIVQKQAGDLQQIFAMHPAFMALQYPLLFPYAERGWQAGVLYAGVIQIRANAHIKVTMQDYYCYMFHYRKDEPNLYLCYGALSSQAKVDARACVDENRLRYIVENQANIRMESIQGICDAINRGSTEGSEMGKMTVLPASHMGGRRYMIQNYHDGIAICREYGPPDFFVTFTCNPKWPEITEAIFDPGQKPVDRNDLIVRVFNMKLEELLHDIKAGTSFGPCNAVLHTVEFQKRGLPHAHIILWTSTDTSSPTTAMIDKYAAAEIPDPKIDPLGYALVSEHRYMALVSGKNIANYNLPPKTHSEYPVLHNRLVEEELSHPSDPSIDMNSPTISLNEDQANAFNTIVQRVEQNQPKFFFVSGYGGTGKTYLWNRMVGYLRAKNKIVLTVASSGIAALLLQGGHTAHSRFKIPCEVEEDTVCDVSRGTMLSEIIELTSLVIWDEALMANRRCFEALDRTFRDIEKTKSPETAHIPFGGKVVVLGGDLR